MTEKELEQIYNEGYRAVYWTALKLLRNEADAEDIVQDTFVAAYGAYDQLKEKEKVVGWLKKIAANKCLNRLTRTRTVNEEEEFFDGIEAEGEDFLPDSIVESDASRKVIMDIIDNSLSEGIRQTIILFYFDGLSTKEIAEALGIPQGTVLSRLNLAKKKIKKEVEKYEKENNDRLFTAAVPFLTRLFEKEAARVPFRPMPASIAAPSSASVSEALTKGAGIKQAAAPVAAAVQKGTGFMVKKLVIGLVAVTLAGSATVGVVHVVNKSKNDNPGRREETEYSSETSDLTDGTLQTEAGGAEGWTCELCGESGNEGRYCRRCGTIDPRFAVDMSEVSSQSDVEIEGTARVWICESCGQEGNDGRFCNECGAQAPDFWLENGYVFISENTAPFTTVTLLPYEPEEGSFDAPGAYEFNFGTRIPITFHDPESGLDLEAKFSGTISYDIDEGCAVDEDTVRDNTLMFGQIRVQNALEFAGYSNVMAYTYDISRGMSYDLRNQLPVHNVSIVINSISLTEESRALYNEAMGIS